MKLKLAIVLVVTALCLGVVLWDLDFHEAWVALQEARWVLLLPMFGLYFVAHCLRAWRLQLLVGHGVSYGRAFAINTIGFLAINVVPLRLGEMVRPYMFYESEGVPFGRGMAAIVLERLLDMTMLLLMLIGLTLIVDLPEGGIQVEGIDVIAAGQKLAGFLVAAGITVGGVLVFVGEPAIRLLERLPLGAMVAGFARKFREGFLELLRAPLRAMLLFALSVGIWAVTVTAVGTCMAAFQGIPVGVAEAWSTWTITISGMTAIPTPGFFGAYEIFCSAALWIWGVDPDIARTFAIVLHLGQFGFIVVIGGYFLLREGLSLRSLVRAAPPAEDLVDGAAVDGVLAEGSGTEG